MLKVYSPVLGSRTISLIDSNGGDGVSEQILGLNILIELRVQTLIMLDAQRGQVFQTPDQYRSDVVNDTVNPVI